jgi:predicted component of type VI protein secretion system
MHTLPEIGKRRDAVEAFTHSLAALFGRDTSAVNLSLVEAPKDRFAYGGRLLCDLSN